MMKRLAALAAVAAMVMAIGVPTAGAAKPDERIKFVDEFTDIDPFIAAVCGLDVVRVDGVFKVQLNFFDNGRARVHENGKITFTNPSTGDQVFLSLARTFKDKPAQESIDGQLLTLVFETTVNGLPEKWRAPGHGVIVRDAGTLSFRDTLVIDLTIDPEEEDPVIFFDTEILRMGGPHPLFFDGFTEEQGAAICAALGGELQPFPGG